MTIAKSLLLGIAVSFSPAAFSETGPGSGGGGDSYALEFVNVGHRISQALMDEKSLAALLPQVNPRELFKTVNKTAIRTKDQLMLGQVEVDAINHPGDNYIELSRPRWSRLSATPGHQASLVLHEYLAMMGIDDEGYKISGPFKQWQFQNKFPFETITDELRTPGLYRVEASKSFTQNSKDGELAAYCSSTGDIAIMGTCTLPALDPELRDSRGIYSYGIVNPRKTGKLLNGGYRYGWRCSIKPAEGFASGTPIERARLNQITYKIEVLCKIK